MIGRNGMSQTRRVRARALESSALTMALMLAGPAFAQCAPDPTIVNGTTICSGTDVDGLVVTAPGTKVVVDQTATVNGSTGPAITVQLPLTQGFIPVSVTVDGVVDGGSNAGIRHAVQSYSNDYFVQSLILNVAAGGRVTGTNGVSIDRIGQEFFGDGPVSIDNSGDISGTSGIALLSDPNSKNPTEN